MEGWPRQLRLSSGELFPTSRLLFVLLALLLQGSGAAEYNSKTRLESARLYGNLDYYAYYFVDLLVGTPQPQRVSLILDTGSTLVGFPCKNCHHCGHHLDPPFDFSKSTSAHWIACTADGTTCSNGCVDDACSYKQSYTEGSSVTGRYFEDMLQLGDWAEKNPMVKGQLGCHNDEKKLFYTQRANGIVGLAPSGAVPTILDDLFRDSQHINRGIFTVCLSEWGGMLTVGGVNKSMHSAETVNYTTMSLNSEYMVNIRSITLGDATIFSGGDQMPQPGIVDSGTTYTELPSDVYRALKSALEAKCADGACGATFDGKKCWDLSQDGSGPGGFPVIDMQLADGLAFRWSPRAYLYHRGSTSRWCHSFNDAGEGAQIVLGASWMLFHDIIFDLQKMRLGIAEADCPEHRREQVVLSTSEDSTREALQPALGHRPPSRTSSSSTPSRPLLGGMAPAVAVGGGVLLVTSGLLLLLLSMRPAKALLRSSSSAVLVDKSMGGSGVTNQSDTEDFLLLQGREDPA